MSGAFRRRGGGAFDLDSDEDEQIAERRRRKQREEARKRRLLLGDEKLGKFDGNDKKEAFLRAIEDRDEENEVDLLDGKEVDAEETVPDSQQANSQQATETQPLEAMSGNGSKRPRTDDKEESDRPAKRTLIGPHRRVQNAVFQKPASLNEIRESVSFLVEEPNAHEQIVTLSDSEPDGDNDEDDLVQEIQLAPREENRAPYSSRRTPAKTDIVDRLLLKKASASSLNSGAGNTSSTTLAFQTTSQSSFKVPSLLRRATTNQSNSAAVGVVSTSSMRPPALKRDGSSSVMGDNSVRMGGSKKSSINYAAREAERRVVVERVERERLEGVKKVAAMRRGCGLGGFGKGGWGGGFE